MRVAIVAILYLIFFVVVEVVVVRYHLNKETSRKVVHILAAITASCLPFIMTFLEISFLSLLFIPIMIVSMRKNLFSGIHSVERKTYGEIYFPVSIFITSVLFPQRILFVYGLLVMGISDGMASIVGQKYGKKCFNPGSKKTYIGSIAFFITSFLIGFVLFWVITGGLLRSMIMATFASVLLMFTESSLVGGLDNLVLSPLAAWMMWFLIKL